MSDSARPHRWQPNRLPRPWDSPGKNTGVGCHFLLQCMKVKSESEVAQSCLTLRDPMDCSPPGSSIHGILQARALERVPSPSPDDSSIQSQMKQVFLISQNLLLLFKIYFIFFKRNSLVVQWLELGSLTAMHPGSIPGQGSKMP